MKILIVEDDAETASYVSRGLREAGWDVTWHDAPQAAMLTLAGRSFDAIVLDRMLPGLDGLALLTALRSKKSTPVIMLTAVSGVDDRVDGLRGGADDLDTNFSRIAKYEPPEHERADLFGMMFADNVVDVSNTWSQATHEY